MRVRCPAKLNLDLRVGPRRADGFHSIRSWFVAVDLCDELTIEPADAVSLTCSDPSVPCDERNLVIRAARALQAAELRRDPSSGGAGAAMRLTKNIPAGGGLGGGSSDAASALLALNDFWRLGHTREGLHAIAATLGSDVPFFLHAPSAVCTGRGEVVAPEPPPAAAWAVLVLPDVGMPTPAVFRRLDELRPAADAPGPFVRPAATAATDLLPRLVNDLEAAAFSLRPDLGTLRDTLERDVGRPVRMSGSGSTLFTLYDDEDTARRSATAVSEAHGVRCVAVRLCGG